MEPEIMINIGEHKILKFSRRLTTQTTLEQIDCFFDEAYSYIRDKFGVPANYFIRKDRDNLEMIAVIGFDWFMYDDPAFERKEIAYQLELKTNCIISKHPITEVTIKEDDSSTLVFYSCPLDYDVNQMIKTHFSDLVRGYIEEKYKNLGALYYEEVEPDMLLIAVHINKE